MDIREVTKEEKDGYIARVKDVFDDIRNVLNTLETDMVSDDLMTQASSVWIGGNLCTWYNDFMNQIKQIDQHQKTLKNIQGELKDAVESNPRATH